jgi:MoxR-like ATPase
MPNPSWSIFGSANPDLSRLPAVPPWRGFAAVGQHELPYHLSDDAVRAVNAALYLRRPLLVTGVPGTGKSTLAREVARQLRAERFVKWPINSRSTLGDALYRYDAIGRLRDASMIHKGRRKRAAPPKGIGSYLTLGPLGTALAPVAPPDGGSWQAIRVLLIDELDKSDLDLPDDLLDVLEDGSFIIPELHRLRVEEPKVVVTLDGDGVGPSTLNIDGGRVSVDPKAYPFILITSNGERELSPAFLRRCVRLKLAPPNPTTAMEIVTAHLDALPEPQRARVDELAKDLLGDTNRTQHAVDQLLNLAFLIARGETPAAEDSELAALRDVVAHPLDREE